MLKANVRTAQEMFEELGYKKDENFPPEKPTYENEYLSLTITKEELLYLIKQKQLHQ